MNFSIFQPSFSLKRHIDRTTIFRLFFCTVTITIWMSNRKWSMKIWSGWLAEWTVSISFQVSDNDKTLKHLLWLLSVYVHTIPILVLILILFFSSLSSLLVCLWAHCNSLHWKSICYSCPLFIFIEFSSFSHYLVLIFLYFLSRSLSLSLSLSFYPEDVTF